MEGLKCSECSRGYFLSPIGCYLCDCLGRTTDCSQNSSVTSEPSEVCDCPPPYAGDSCGTCEAGWYIPDGSVNCTECQCNGLAYTCQDGDGICVVRRGTGSIVNNLQCNAACMYMVNHKYTYPCTQDCQCNSTGAHCEECKEGFYLNLTSSANPCNRCHMCPCNNITARRFVCTPSPSCREDLDSDIHVL